MQFQERSRSEVDVAIVGAGAAGVAAARQLKTICPHLSVLVLEAGSRMGGRALTLRPEVLAGEPIDLGCGWLHGAGTNAWRKIAGDVGLTVDQTPAPWSEGGRRLQSDPEAEDGIEAFFARVDGYSAETDVPLSAMLEPGHSANARIEAIGTYLNGASLYQASLIDYRHYAPGEGPDWRVREGYGTLIGRYAEGLDIRLKTIVSHIDHGAADSVVLTTSCGTLRAKWAIVTVSTNILAAQAIRFTPALPEKVEAAASLPLGLANKMFLAVSPELDMPVDMQAYGSATSSATGSYQIRPFGSATIEAYFAGPLARELESEGEDAALSFAYEELAGLFGSDIRRHLKFAGISGWAASPHIGGSYAYALPGASAARAVLAASVDERLLFAGEACSLSRYSTAHGAYETGIAAANSVASASGSTVGAVRENRSST